MRTTNATMGFHVPTISVTTKGLVQRLTIAPPTKFATGTLINAPNVTPMANVTMNNSVMALKVATMAAVFPVETPVPVRRHFAMKLTTYAVLTKGASVRLTPKVKIVLEPATAMPQMGPTIAA